MQFALDRKDWTDEAASIWGDMLGLDRPATYDEARESLARDGFGGNVADYFDEAGKYLSPCAMAISVKQ